jgi:hypothetical protein
VAGTARAVRTIVAQPSFAKREPWAEPRSTTVIVGAGLGMSAALEARKLNLTS